MKCLNMEIIDRKSLIYYIKQLHRRIFTTFELASISGKSLSTTTQSLNYLQREGVIFKIYRGIWAEIGSDPISPYAIIPFLFQRQRAYVSFISALHLYGIIEQIPQMITLASLSHRKIIKTSIASYSVHRIEPRFFCGFDWYKKEGDFLIAEPEKALIDSLYISAYKKKQFRYFPELYFPKSFSFKKAEKWIERIGNVRIRIYVKESLNKILRMESSTSIHNS